MDSFIEEKKPPITDIEILNEAFARKKPVKISTKVDVIDLEELKDYQLRKRTEYESYLKRNRLDIGQWIRYALFEIEQHDMRRARSIFERALLVDISCVPLWIRYIDCELKYKYVNHARNILERAVSTLPRVDKLWYKYLFVEESLENWNIVRSLYNRWVSLEPNFNAWDSYIDFEIRQNQMNNVRNIYSRYVNIFPETTQVWFKWLKFESIYGSNSTIRKVYSIAVDTLISHEKTLSNIPDFQENLIELIISFANWEAFIQETERAKAIFSLAIEKWPNNTTLNKSYLDLKKRYGDSQTIDEGILVKRKSHYEKLLSERKKDYDTWWIYLDFIEENFPSQMLVSLKKATDLNNKPPLNLTQSKVDILWQRYLYLWIRRLIYIELKSNNISRCRELYSKVIEEIIIPSKLSYNKIWLMFAQFEIRQENIDLARKILGRCIGISPNKELFQEYINIEIKLKEFDRVRKLYEKFIEFNPMDMSTWFAYIQLEENLGDEDRVRGIFRIMLNNEVMNLGLDVRKIIMEKFITFETDVEEYNNGKSLYREFLEITNYSLETWISYAMYVCSVPTDDQLIAMSEANRDLDEDNEIMFEPDEVNFDKGREVYEEALMYFKNKNDSKNRFELLKALQEFEKRFGTDETQDRVSKRLPKLERIRFLQNGVESEKINYIFPEDNELSVESENNSSKFLALAKKWKQDQNK